MVQLKALGTGSGTNPAFLFQFLDGTIKRKRVTAYNDTLVNFNSLMVQLKEIKKLGGVLYLTNFNSLMVQLKGRCA